MLPPLTGAAVGFASRQRGSRRFTVAAVRGRVLCGVQSFDDTKQITGKAVHCVRRATEVYVIDLEEENHT